MEFTVTLERKIQYHYTLQAGDAMEANTKLRDLIDDVRSGAIIDFESVCEEEDDEWLFLDMEEIE